MTISARFSGNFGNFPARIARGQRQFVFLAFMLMFAQVVSAQTVEMPSGFSTTITYSYYTNETIETIVTGVPSDLAISGPGYFLLHDPESSLMYVTRYGAFMIDANGFLVSSDGMRVQGYCDAALTQFGDIKLDNTGAPDGDTAPVISYFINSNGLEIVQLADGVTFTRAQVLLQNFSHPEYLQPAGKQFSAWENQAVALPQPSSPGSNGLGLLQTSRLEQPVSTLKINKVKGPAPLLAHGLLHQTGVPTDLGIEGNGYFILRDPESQSLYASRAGAFEVDSNGFLINYSGLRVQGFKDDTLSVIGDIQIEREPVMNNLLAVTRSGKVWFNLPDGGSGIAGQILLSDCLQPARLAPTNFSLFPVDTNRAAWSPLAMPGQNGLGWIAQGTVETKQFDALIFAMRRKMNFISQGSIQATTNVTDLAINGAGFFVVRNPTNNAFCATRNGHFHMDGAGHLVSTNGWRLQGLTDAALSVQGDLIIDGSQSPYGDTDTNVFAFSFSANGEINIQLSDGTLYTRGSITLQGFYNVQALQTTDGIFFNNLAAALPMFSNGFPGTSGLGTIVEGASETLTSYRMPETDPLPQAGFRIQANNLLDGANSLESSDDMVHWAALGQVNANDIGAAEYYDTNPPAASGRFYRAVVAPAPPTTITQQYIFYGPVPTPAQ